jgi:hypothetical protein
MVHAARCVSRTVAPVVAGAVETASTSQASGWWSSATTRPAVACGARLVHR